MSVDPVGFTMGGPASVCNANMCRKADRKVQSQFHTYRRTKLQGLNESMNTHFIASFSFFASFLSSFNLLHLTLSFLLMCIIPKFCSKPNAFLHHWICSAHFLPTLYLILLCTSSVSIIPSFHVIVLLISIAINFTLSFDNETHLYSISFKFIHANL